MDDRAAADVAFRKISNGHNSATRYPIHFVYARLHLIKKPKITIISTNNAKKK